jgi:predicted O-methyltransferase YrrM
VRPGGFLLADNVLWSGKVLKQDADKVTRAIQQFNRKVQDDQRVWNMLLPLRDGVMIMQRK